MRNKRAMVLAGLGFMAAGGAAIAAQVNFNNPDDLANNFTINVQTGASTLTGYPGYLQTPNGGVGDSGGVDVTAGPSATLDSTAIYNKQSFNPVDGKITLSEFVKVQSTQTGDRLLHLGVIDDLASDRRMNGGGAAHADFISARMSPSVNTVAGATTSPFVFTAQSGQSDGTLATTTTTSANSAAVDLTLGNWYQFIVDVLRSDTPNTFTVSGSLQDFGADGSSAGQIFSFAAQNLTANTADMYNDTSVYGAWRSHAAKGGADMLDEFSVTQAQVAVPEPASVGLLGLAALSLVGRRRRK
jgi:hypothetical protein